MTILKLVDLYSKEILKERIFDGVLEEKKIGIAVVDERGIIIDHNKSLKEIWCITKPNITGCAIKEIIPEGTFSQTIFKDKKIYLKVERKNIDYNGKDSYLDIYQFQNNDDQIIKEIEEIKDQIQKYDNILNSIDEGVYVVDTGGYLLFYNPALERLEGYKSENVLERHVTELYPLDWETSLLLKVISTGKPILDYYQEYYINDRQISIICNTVPLYANGTVVGAASIVRDFSRFKEMVEKNLDLQEKLINKNDRGGNKSYDKDMYFSFGQIIGENTSLKECISWGKAAAQTESSVLIYGETGTGKEMFAQSIHMESTRAKGPFLGLNVAAIPETLLEGILFGTSKGAFTGAINRVGMLEQANSGTLFLDEINSMSVTLQAKLLRVLEEKKIRRLGDNEIIHVDVRIISSCNIEPSEAIEKGQLRSDLFYRLAVVYLVIPPLRERMDDLEMLADFFIQQYNNILKRNILGLSDEVFEAFRGYYWPGNIRQLKHCIECAMNVGSKDTLLIKIEHLPRYLMFSPNNHVDAVFDEIEDSEKNRIIIALKKNSGNIARTAVELGISRQNLQYRIKKYNLK